MTMFVVQFLSFTALYSSRYFTTAANELEILHIHRKRLTSELKNKVDRPYHSASVAVTWVRI